MKTQPRHAPIGAAWCILHQGASRCLYKGCDKFAPFLFLIAASQLLGMAKSVDNQLSVANRPLQRLMRATHPPDLLPLALTLEMVEQPACLTDKADRFVFVNSAFLRIYGYEETFLLGRKPPVLHPPEQPVSRFKEIRRATRAGEWQGELENMDSTGRRFGIRLNTRALLLDNGRFPCFLGMGCLTPVPSRDTTTNGCDMSLLSARERMIFDGLCHGEGSKAMGSRLGISQHTVDTYKKRIYRKLGFENQADLLKFLLSQNRPQLPEIRVTIGVT